ncbi:unnamed protein product [Owenia fusiformis]|uniref:VWFA domain-containing protein n=1 Tax=Owenia fusiformis TaxID=6347 RepID=A0A8S4PXN9_OWEFU|nr:unnamed protein product [Owenia fusiformis]
MARTALVILALLSGVLYTSAQITSTSCGFEGLAKGSTSVCNSWTQDTNDDADWTVGEGSTPSGNTGPSGARSGSKYGYFEATDVKEPNRRTRIISPTLLGTGYTYNVSYGYHMFGSHIGRVRVYTRQGGSLSEVAAAGRQGQQQTSSDAPWGLQTVTLPLINGNFEVVFEIENGINLEPGNDHPFRGDIAIDDIGIEGTNGDGDSGNGGEDSGSGASGGCAGGTADIGFVVDFSGSLDDTQLRSVLDFTKSLIDLLDIGEDNVRVGFISFTNEVITRFKMNEMYEKAEILAKIDPLLQNRGNRGSTNLAGGLNQLIDDLYAPGNGERDGIIDIAIVITDGKSSPEFRDALPAAVQKIKNRSGMIQFGIGVKNADFDEAELRSIVTSDAYYFDVEDTASLQEITAEVVQKTCKKKPEHPCHEKCQYTPPPPKTDQPGLRRYSRVNAILDCTYEDNCDIQFLKDFAAELDRQPNCKMYYPLKAAAENRLYVVYGCDSAGHLEKALFTKDPRFKCDVQPVMDYYDFATLTLGLEVSPNAVVAIMPRASLKCETLIAVFRELSYPPGKTYDEIISAWRAHAEKSFLQKGTPEGGNREVFHYVGEEREVVFRVWDNPEQLDYNTASAMQCKR